MASTSLADSAGQVVTSALGSVPHKITVAVIPSIIANRTVIAFPVVSKPKISVAGAAFRATIYGRTTRAVSVTNSDYIN